MSEFQIVVVGATGAVGKTFLSILQERHFPIHRLKVCASERSLGRTLLVNGREHTIELVTDEVLGSADLVFISASTEVSRSVGQRAAEMGAIAIDDSAAFRMDPSVPLVVPEVNSSDLDSHQGIVATPNCSTTPLVMVLDALRKVSRIERVVVSTYQSVSGTGVSALTELREQTKQLLDGRTVETRKILHLPDLPISATCVRVPVNVGHSESIHIDLADTLDPVDVRASLMDYPGIRIVDDPVAHSYPMPLDAEGIDDVLVGRVRADTSHERGIALWLSCDNLRKGAALNAIQIAEEMIRRRLAKPRV